MNYWSDPQAKAAKDGYDRSWLVSKREFEEARWFARMC
jgi:hypothetical protein